MSTEPLPDAYSDYGDLVAGQRAYFLSGATRPVAWRRAQLEALKAMIEENRDRFYSALYDDLRRNKVDADQMDVGFCINEAEYTLKLPLSRAGSSCVTIRLASLTWTHG